MATGIGTNGDRHSPMAPIAMGCIIGAIIAITIGANGCPLVPSSGTNGANGAIGEMSYSLFRHFYQFFFLGALDVWTVIFHSGQLHSCTSHNFTLFQCVHCVGGYRINFQLSLLRRSVIMILCNNCWKFLKTHDVFPTLSENSDKRQQYLIASC